MNVLSLCSGGGGLELGIGLAVPGATTIAYVERDACAVEVLAARMEDGSLAPAPIWFDLRIFRPRLLAGRVDLVAAGFPCQPHSLAGKRGGVDDDRWLWDSVWRIVREVRAPVLFVENVPGLLTSGGFDRVLADLAAGGWAAEWDCIPAASVGAPHIRDRVFLLAANSTGIGRSPWRPEEDGRQAWREAVGASVANPNGVRLHEAVDGVRPRQPDSQGTPPADADSIGREQQRLSGVFDCERATPGRDADGCVGAQPSDATSAGLEGQGQGLLTASTWAGRPAPEPTVCGVDDGLARQVDRDRLFVLGNGVVPQAAAQAWRTLWGRLTP